jgi:phage portal protein BeeE
VGVIERVRDALSAPAEQRYTWADVASWGSSFTFGGASYGLGQAPLQTTLGGNVAETINADFVGLSSGAYKANGIIFACMLNRQLVFSTVRFQYQQLAGGRPSTLFGDQSLLLLETPWPGGTTQDLLSRVINDADLAGNNYTTSQTSLATLGGDGGKSLLRLRPDWVGVLQGRRKDGLGYDKLGIVYRDGGLTAGRGDDVYLLPGEFAHFAPIPDPLASHVGMSWLTPVIREIQADQLMTMHKRKFFENGATPNMVIKYPPEMTAEKIKAFRNILRDDHEGLDNAYKTLHLGGGADPTVVGANFQQIEFAVSQGHGETRIAAAAGVPALIVGLSGGMEAAQYANYGPTRRRYADGTMHPLWQNVAGSFAPLLGDSAALKRPGVRLWYDSRDVPFLREDEKDAAEIQSTEAQTIATLVREGFTWDSVKAAVLAGDFGLLEHSGLFSVQLQVAGAQAMPAPNGKTPMPATGGK